MEQSRVSQDAPEDEVCRRRMPRYPQRLTLRYSTDDVSWHHSATQNVGPWGMFIHSRQFVVPGDIMELVIELPDGRTLQARARVMWEAVSQAAFQRGRVSGFGVRLESMPEAWYGWIATLTSPLT